MAASISYVTSATGGTGTTTRTFSSVSTGAEPGAGEKKYIIASMGWKDGSTTAGQSLSSGTIAGNAATVGGSQQGTSASSRSLAGIMVYGPLTGTTADIAFTWSTDPGSFHYMSVHRVIVPTSEALVLTPYDSAGDIHVSPSVSINIPAGGVAVGSFQDVNGSPVTWTGLTEDVENDTDASDIQSVASDAFATLQTAYAIDVNPFGTETNAALFVASYGVVSLQAGGKLVGGILTRPKLAQGRLT